MKQINLTRGKVTFVDDEDYVYLSQWKWCYHCGYARRREGKNTVHMHRILLNCPDGFEGDHINRNKLDNQKCNLRIVTRQQNVFNRDAFRNSVSEYKGVTWHKGDQRWHAQIRHNNQLLFLGAFNEEKIAAAAYNFYAKKYFGGYAVLNNVPEADFQNERVLKGTCASKFRGVTYNKRAKRWIARIGVDKNRLWLGSFKNERDAAIAYNKAFSKFKSGKVVANIL